MNAQVLFSQFVYTDRLKQGGFSEDQARASAEALGLALSETVATKSDLATVQAQLEASMARMRTSIIVWIVGIALAVSTVGAAVAGFLFKHIP
jgi:hypothetical protein